MPANDPRATKAQRREEARAQALKLRQEQERKAKRNRWLAIGGLVAAVAVLAVVVSMILSQGQQTANIVYSGDDAPTLSTVPVPAAAGANGGIPVGADEVAGADVPADATVVTVYLDYLCPYCADFEAINADDLQALRADGTIVEYHPISILDRLSVGTSFSTRAANAAAVVADQAPAQFVAFNDALFANQPDENTKGLSDDEIAEIAAGVGVSSQVTDAFTAQSPDGPWRTFAGYVAALTDQGGVDLQALGMDGLSTPTILIDGQLLDSEQYPWQVEGNLALAVAAAQAGTEG